MIAAAEDCIQQDIWLIIDSTPSSFYMLRNSYCTFYQALNQSAFMYIDTTLNYVDQMYAIVVILTVVSIVIIGAVVFFFVKPVLWMIEGT